MIPKIQKLFFLCETESLKTFLIRAIISEFIQGSTLSHALLYLLYTFNSAEMKVVVLALSLILQLTRGKHYLVEVADEGKRRVSYSTHALEINFK